ncbi:MAG TPA: cytochrome c-type biogenesis protein CcmH [Solirubrobacterales bacterium]
MRLRATLALLGVAALTLTAVPALAAPQTSLPDVEDEVMCPICGTLLELSDSPQARREKAFIAGLIAQGKTKAEIKDALVAEYGHEVLALPRGSGFDLSAYLVPIVGFAVALTALAFGVARWRRDGGSPESEQTEKAASAGPSDEDAKRLDADLAKYDL